MRKVCIARVDRIGDFILTLPMEGFWRKTNPSDEVVWLAHENVRFVTEHLDQKIKCKFISTPNSLLEKIQLAFELRKWFVSENFKLFLSVHVPWWVALASFLAQIPDRVGTRSQWYSWLFFTRRLKQKRSQAVMHESQYNIELANFALKGSFAADVTDIAKLTANPENVLQWQKILKNLFC